MALSGLAQQWLRVFNDSITTSHLDAGDDAPFQLQGFRNYMFFDSADYRLGMAGGDTFDMRFNAAEGNHLKPINSGGTRSLTRTDNVDVMSARTRLYYQDFAITDREVENDKELMAYVAAGKPRLFFQKLYKVRKAKEQEATATLANDCERITAAFGNYDKMENRNLEIEAAMSYLALVNEWYLGLPGIITATGLTAGSGGTDYNTQAVAEGGRFVKKQNIDPTLSKYTVNGTNVMAPYKATYTTLDDIAVTSMWNAMLKAVRETTYDKPPAVPNMMDSGIVAQSGTNEDAVWYVGSRALDYLTSVVNAKQTLWVMPSRKDPSVPNPMVGGVPVDYWQMLNTYAGYNGSSRTVLTTEGAGDVQGPRAYLHRRKTCYPVAHHLNWFRKRIPPRSMLVPDVHGEFTDLEITWFCQDFRTQACVYPASTPSGLAAY